MCQQITFTCYLKVLMDPKDSCKFNCQSQLFLFRLNGWVHVGKYVYIAWGSWRKTQLLKQLKQYLYWTIQVFLLTKPLWYVLG